MNGIGKRIYILRKELNLSMEQFGERIGISKSAISGFEKSKTNPSEQTIILICQIYGVNSMWLKNGIGDMFLEFPKTELDRIAQDYDLDETDKLILEVYLESSAEERKYIKHFLQTFAKKIEQKKGET